MAARRAMFQGAAAMENIFQFFEDGVWKHKHFAQSHVINT